MSFRNVCASFDAGRGGSEKQASSMPSLTTFGLIFFPFYYSFRFSRSPFSRLIHFNSFALVTKQQPNKQFPFPFSSINGEPSAVFGFFPFGSAPSVERISLFRQPLFDIWIWFTFRRWGWSLCECRSRRSTCCYDNLNKWFCFGSHRGHRQLTLSRTFASTFSPFVAVNRSQPSRTCQLFYSVMFSSN